MAEKIPCTLVAPGGPSHRELTLHKYLENKELWERDVIKYGWVKELHQNLDTKKQGYKNENYVISVAPNTITIAGSIIMAIAKYCAIIGVGSDKNQSDHNITVDESRAEPAVKMILDYMENVKCKKFYNMVVKRPFDLNDEPSYLTILVAVAKMIQEFEPEFEERTLRDAIGVCLESNGIRLNNMTALLDATFTGSLHKVCAENFSHVFMEPITKDGSDTRVQSGFLLFLDMVYIRTSDHPVNPGQEVFRDKNTEDKLRGLIELKQKKPSLEIPSALSVYTETHHEILASTNKLTDLDIHMFESQKENYKEYDIRDFKPGVDVQKGGMLLLCTKNCFRIKYRSIFKSICEKQGNQNLWISADIIHPGTRAHVVQHTGNFGEEKQYHLGYDEIMNYPNGFPPRPDTPPRDDIPQIAEAEIKEEIVFPNDELTAGSNSMRDSASPTAKRARQTFFEDTFEDDTDSD